jgi:hypothetical protein
MNPRATDIARDSVTPYRHDKPVRLAITLTDLLINRLKNSWIEIEPKSHFGPLGRGLEKTRRTLPLVLFIFLGG